MCALEVTMDQETLKAKIAALEALRQREGSILTGKSPNPLVYPPWGQESNIRQQSISLNPGAQDLGNPNGTLTDDQYINQQQSSLQQQQDAQNKLALYKKLGLI
jgi:hypothetical protein